MESSLIHQPIFSELWPNWLQEKQRFSWKKFLELKDPSPRDEAWRFAHLKNYSLAPFHLPDPCSDPSLITRRSVGLSSFAAKFIFANNHLIHSEKKGLPSEVLLMPLEQAAREYEKLVRPYFMKQEVRLGSRKFAALHHAQLRTGVFLYVPSGIRLEEPIELWHWAEGAHSAIFPHTLILCGEGSHASVIEHFFSADSEPHFSCALQQLVVGKQADLNYLALQQWNDQTTAFHLNTVEVSEKAASTTLQLNLGGAHLRTESDSRLVGREARSIMLSINPAHGTQEIDQRTFQDHVAPAAMSDLLYHNALSDQARTIFAGLIKVETEAHQTDAYQKVSNLMLSDEAEANSMPGLEILADEVRCTHGATSGELNKEELFYLLARGIPRQAAAQLIVRGFFQTVLDRVEEPLLREYAGKMLDERF
ncbi:MAG: Fe-S cluster assembly protein SufD [Chthoniobacterales bacterium]|nr:Fe-S cluster assembly protein SufD [Chthoniobacterales bacterium]